MKKHEFWEDWKRITRLEEKAIESLNAAKRLILKNIPNDEIVAIYVYGSFVRREMHKDSDVDTKTIVTKSKYMKNLAHLQKKYRKAYYPPIEFSGYSIWELKTGKNIKKGKPRPSGSRFLKRLSDFKLIYGKPLQIEKYKLRSETQDLRGMVNVFRELFIPEHKRGRMGMNQLTKQVFWLTEYELRAANKKVPYALKGLIKLVPENHILHDAYRYQKKPTKDKKLKAAFIRKLEKHLDNLEKKYLS